MKAKIIFAILLVTIMLTSCSKKMIKGVVQNIIGIDDVLDSTDDAQILSTIEESESDADINGPEEETAISTQNTSSAVSGAGEGKEQTNSSIIETSVSSPIKDSLWNPSAFVGKRYEYDDGAVMYEVEFYEKNSDTWLSLGSNSSGGTGTGLACIDIMLEANKTSYENVNVIVAGIGVVEANNTLRIIPGEDSLFIEWKNESGDAVAAADFYPVADFYHSENIPPETGLVESFSDTAQIFTSSCGPLQKDGDQYYYSGEIMGYDESLIVDDDWTTGYYTLTSGTFYTDEATKIIIETESDYGFPAGEKSVVEWLDDFYARKEYWMTVNIKVNGDHIEEILGIYSIC